MRVKIIYSGNNLIKKVKGSNYLFNLIKNELSNYTTWLKEAGLNIPDTRIEYTGGEIHFIQQKINATHEVNYKIITKIISELKFSRYGLDPNPNNFIQSNDNIFFVDFYPFLIQDKKSLKEQFSYDLSIVHERYFNSTNILVTYLNRLFKIDSKISLELIVKEKNILIREFHSILPREKKRLLKILIFTEKKLSNKSDEFSKYYIKSKYYINISSKDELLLYNYLKRL